MTEKPAAAGFSVPIWGFGTKLEQIFIFDLRVVDKPLYDQKAADIQRERITLTRQISEVQSRGSVSTLEPTRQLFLQANKAKNEFLAADDYKKRSIVESLLWNLSIEDGKVAQVKYKSPFDIMAKAPKNADSCTLLGDLARAPLSSHRRAPRLATRPSRSRLLARHRSGLRVQDEKRAGAFLPPSKLRFAYFAGGLGLEPR